VPTHDRDDLLAEALASIRALKIEDVEFEIIVCDNGQSPQTNAVAQKYGARYVQTERKGAAAARNGAMRLASGEFIAFLDDDDLWTRDHVRCHLAALGAQPELEAVIGQAITTDTDRRPVGAAWPDTLAMDRAGMLRRLLSGLFPQIGTVVLRRSALARFGYFDESLIGGEDLDWLLRIARRHALGFCPVPSVLFRSRPRGTFDALQRQRVGFDRLVFLRHAIPEWRIWGSPMAFSRAYSATLMQFYKYFAAAALERASLGKRRAALRAIWDAAGVFPLRAVYHLVARRQLRAAMGKILDFRRSQAQRASVQP
jgi:glycosyltransferase involved in cell wall biosynthesis